LKHVTVDFDSSENHNHQLARSDLKICAEAEEAIRKTSGEQTLYHGISEATGSHGESWAVHRTSERVGHQIG